MDEELKFAKPTKMGRSGTLGTKRWYFVNCGTHTFNRAKESAAPSRRCSDLSPILASSDSLGSFKILVELNRALVSGPRGMVGRGENQSSPSPIQKFLTIPEGVQKSKSHKDACHENEIQRSH
jgi:hypothetical protein